MITSAETNIYGFKRFFIINQNTWTTKYPDEIDYFSLGKRETDKVLT